MGTKSILMHESVIRPRGVRRKGRVRREKLLEEERNWPQARDAKHPVRKNQSLVGCIWENKNQERITGWGRREKGGTSLRIKKGVAKAARVEPHSPIPNNNSH